MGPLRVVKPEPLPEPLLQLRYRLVVVQIHAVILHRPPQTLHENIVQSSPPAIHADPYPVARQHVRKFHACVLAALIRIENLGLPLLQRLQKSADAKIRLHTVRDVP